MIHLTSVNTFFHPIKNRFIILFELHRLNDRDSSSDEQRIPDPAGGDVSEEILYDDIIQEGEGGAAIGSNFPPMKMAQVNSNRQSQNDNTDNQARPSDEELDITALPHKVTQLNYWKHCFIVG